MKSELVKGPTSVKLTARELAEFMRDYEFVQFVKDLDQRADEAKRSGKYKEVLNGRIIKPEP